MKCAICGKPTKGTKTCSKECLAKLRSKNGTKFVRTGAIPRPGSKKNA